MVEQGPIVEQTGEAGAGKHDGIYRLWAVAGVLGAITALRLLYLFVFPFDLYADEAQYWVWAQDFAFGYFSKPPMVAWIIMATTAVCGDGVACVKLAVPLIHFLTALTVYGIGRRLFDERVGFFSALLFGTLPAVSFSAAIISTDPPLLLFWALALYGLVRALDDGAWRWWLLTGLGIGLGLMSKYAMAYFIFSLAVYFALPGAHRDKLLSPRLGAALLLAAALCLPNVVWNANNGFVSFAHTAANANLAGPLINPGEFLEFLAAQFAVFGPILFAALLVCLLNWRAWTGDRRYRLLASFTFPTLALVLGLSFLSRANANWAAPAYVAGTVLVTGWALEKGRRLIVTPSLALHLVLAFALFGATLIEGGPAGLVSDARFDPFKRVQGWRQLGDAVTQASARFPGVALLFDHRRLMAELIYYVDPHPFDASKWNPDGRINDHFDLTRGLGRSGAAGAKDKGRRFLLVTSRADRTAITSRFAHSRIVAHIRTPMGKVRHREVRIIYLEDFLGY
jgi:4-amino-4-deoxy-L-arabinose transferase-like glycosyltransferase